MLAGRSAQRAARSLCLQCRTGGLQGQPQLRLAASATAASMPATTSATKVAMMTTTAARRQQRSQRTGRSNKGAQEIEGEEGEEPRGHSLRIFVALMLALGGLVGSQAISFNDAPRLEDGEHVVEQPRRRRDGSKEANRDAISSQHVQVKQSWERPGVFAWGANSGGVADPEASRDGGGGGGGVVKNPRRMAFFDGKLLRDLKLDKGFGAAVDEKGDLYIWGNDYSKESKEPEKILQGKKLRALAISQDRVFALSSGGQVYSVPVSKEDQLAGSKPYESSWIPFWYSRSRVSYKVLDVPDKAWGEKITSIASGLEHGLLLTSTGRLFSFASSSTAYPSRGQLGVPGITSWEHRPAGPYDAPHSVATLKGFSIESMATGDYHSLVLDSSGRVFGFGDNSSGQLGFEVSSEAPYIDAPCLQNTNKLYMGSSQTPKVTSIAAGGAVSFMTVDATRVASPNDDPEKAGAGRAQLGRVTADTWAFGQGIYGTLGTGRWSHVQGEPARVKALSGLFEYDETNNAIVPIRLSHISVGSTHAAAVMDNVTHVGATARSGENDVNWGADVLWWGGNEYYQLGTGKRANVNVPTYIGPLDKIGDGSKRDEHRLHITPLKKVSINGRRVKVEQRVECGRMVSAVYSRVVD